MEWTGCDDSGAISWRNSLRDRLIFRAASEGAHLRSAAASISEQEFTDLSLPRSVVLIASEARARLAAEAAVALATDARAPIMVARTLPHYVSALDLVMVLTDDPGDTVSEALAEAVRRGADTVLVDPGAGPVRAAGGDRTRRISRPALSDASSYCGYLGAIFGTLTCCGVTALGGAGVLTDVADVVDEDMAACGLDKDVAVNPARQTAHWLRNRTPVFVGPGEAMRLAAELAEEWGRPVSDGDAWRSIAELGAANMLDGGRVAHGTAQSDFLRSLPVLLQNLEPPERDIFFDPLIDDTETRPEVLPLGAIIVAPPATLPILQDRFGDTEWARIECPATVAETRHPLVDICLTAARVAAIAAYATEQED